MVPPGSPGAQLRALFSPYENSDWSDDLEDSIEVQDDVPTSSQSTGTSTTRAPGGLTVSPHRASQPDGAIDPDDDYEYEEEDLPKRSTVDAMNAIFDSAPGVAANDAGLQEEEEEDEYLTYNYLQATRTANRDRTPAGGADDGDAENPWKGYDVPRQEPPTRFNIRGGEKWICPYHGPTCRPGICEARADVEGERRREKVRNEREEARRKGKEMREKRKKAADRKARKLAQAQDREVSSGSELSGALLMGIERKELTLDLT